MKRRALPILFFVICAAAALCLGPEIHGPTRVLRFLAGSEPGVEQEVFRQIRLPRAAAGFLAGAGLAVAGAALQAVLRNPLAESYTIGISGGASLGVCAGVVLGIPSAAPLFAFLGAMLSAGLTIAAGTRKRLSNPTLVLAGVILNFIFSSLVLFILAVSSRQQFHETFFWMLGDLAAPPREVLGPAAVFVPLAAAAVFAAARRLDLLVLGDDKAATLGLPVERSKKLLLVLSALLTGFCVSLAGMIGFVGLVVPHAVRLVCGSTHRRVLPASFLVGGAFLILCDAVGRTLVRPVEIPVGVITGFAGGIAFLLFLLRRRKEEMW